MKSLSLEPESSASANSATSASYLYYYTIILRKVKVICIIFLIILISDIFTVTALCHFLKSFLQDNLLYVHKNSKTLSMRIIGDKRNAEYRATRPVPSPAFEKAE